MPKNSFEETAWHQFAKTWAIVKRLFDFPRIKILIDGNSTEFVILSTSWIRAPQPDVMTSGCPFCSEANLSKSLRSPPPRLKPENGPFLPRLCQNVPQLPQLSKTHTNICLDLFCTAEYCLIYICILTSPSNWKCNEVVYLSGVASLSQSMWFWVQAENENSTFTFGSKPRNLLTLMEQSLHRIWKFIWHILNLDWASMV